MRILSAAAGLAVFGLAAASTAQGPLMQPGLVAGGPAAVQDVTQALHTRGAGDSGLVNAYGEPFVVPASHCASCYGGAPCYGGGPCYGPGGGGDPYGVGSMMNTEQCGPHYFDIAAEYLRYERDDSPVSDTIFSTIGFANEDLSGLADSAVLSGSDLDADALDGFRLTGRLDLGALSVFEVAYSGLYSEDDAAYTVTDNSTARLFSVFSRYGTRTNGPAGSTPGGPIDSAGSGNVLDNNPGGVNFAETDFASTHEITFDSTLQSAEASYRRYWVGYNPRVSGTILLGFRYTSLSETLGFNSIGSTPRVDQTGPYAADPTSTISISADADNHLAGFQFGGDGWVTVIPGLRIGGEAKAGIYNNDYEMTSSVVAADGSPSSLTITSGNQVAFLTEARLSAVADITPCLSLKAGYELLYISDLALMNDSLAQVLPYGDINGLGDATQGAGMTTNGDVLYHGFHAGAEWVW